MTILSNRVRRITIIDITLAAQQRLKFDPNPIVKPMMNRPDLNLDDMLS